jgi:hypothetical protein
VPTVVADADCRTDGDYTRVADALLEHRYILPPHPAVSLPAVLTWREDPFHDNNWRFQFHALGYVVTLLERGAETGDGRYVARATELVRSWLASNPREAPPSSYSWYDHSTALRARVLVCVAGVIGLKPWLRAGLVLHGEVLSDRDEWSPGNHGTDQMIGLLDIGCLLGRQDWRSLAADRIHMFMRTNVDAEGVSIEQAVGYQHYTWMRFEAARELLRRCDQPVGDAFARHALMPRMLAHATLPNREYELLGDTLGGPAPIIQGTIAEYAATAGASGPKPRATDARYSAGFLFARTGWGETRRFANEVAWTMRYGPARIQHGHLDHGSLTLYGFGRRLLLDPGLYQYESTALRRWIISRSAHNVVTADRPFILAHSPLLRFTRRPSSIDVVVDVNAHQGIEHQRRVIFSRRLHYLVVEDRLSSQRSSVFKQLWHLREGADPTRTRGEVATHARLGNVLIRQLIGGGTTRFVTGSSDPPQGWVSYRYNEIIPAPMVEVERTGRSARYLTLIVPSARPDPSVTVDVSSIRVAGFTLTIRTPRGAERLRATRDGVEIIPLG